MIPAGFPPGWMISHKTGQVTGIHHDAAIARFPIGPLNLTLPAVLVVMTRGFDDPTQSAELGARVAHRFFEPGHTFGESWEPRKGDRKPRWAR